MAISDVVVGNLTTLVLVAIAATRAYGMAVGRSFSGTCVLVLSTLAVGVVLIVSIGWDISRKARSAVIASDHNHEMCRGGICWHGVAVKSPSSQIRFRLPQHGN